MARKLSKKELEKLEKLELKYLEKYSLHLKGNLKEILKGLNSKNDIKDDWVKHWSRVEKKSKSSLFAVGAERVIYHQLGNFSGVPNSSPIGSDLFFEEEDAFVHIDLKTVKTDNIGDANNSIFIGENQNSYSGKISVKGKGGIIEKRKYTSRLPCFYSEGKKHRKPCLTYFITIIYEKDNNNDSLLINMMCMPNGALYKDYCDTILKAGKNKKTKNKPQKARFNFSECYEFKLLKNKKRIIMIYLDEDKCETYRNKLKFLYEIYEKGKS